MRYNLYSDAGHYFGAHDLTAEEAAEHAACGFVLVLSSHDTRNNSPKPMVEWLLEEVRP